MGTILASAVIVKARDILQDSTAVRWTDAEALRWLSEGQRYITLHRPDASAQIADITLVAGTKQALPAVAMRLLDVTRNRGTQAVPADGAPIRIVDREVLDTEVSDWHTQTQTGTIKHYVYDQRNPKNFFVFPPALVDTLIEAIYTIVPAEIAAAGSAIGIDDIYEPVLLDYLLYRALSKDAEYAGNIERATLYMQAVNGALGLKTQIDVATSPNKNAPPYNPNSAGGMR